MANKKTIKKVLAALILSLVLFLVAAPVMAGKHTIDIAIEKATKFDSTAVKNVGPIFDGVTTSCYVVGSCSLCDILIVFVNIANIILRLFAIIGVVMLILGAGFMMLSSGNAERLNKGKTIMKASIIGSLIVLGAWQIMSVVVLLIADQSIFKEQGVSNGGFNPITDWFTIADKCQEAVKSGIALEPPVTD